jgi:hypothetical protein
VDPACGSPSANTSAHAAEGGQRLGARGALRSGAVMAQCITAVLMTHGQVKPTELFGFDI